MQLEGLSQRLSSEIEMASFRIVQEAVTNVLRHAGAQHLDVRVSWAGGQLSMMIKDDGRGVSNEEVVAQAKAGHLGLVGMRERARALGGELTLTSPPPWGETRGTCIEAAFPASAKAVTEAP